MSGRCLCGAVRYETDAEPLFAGHCHCRDCQRTTGAGHISFIGVPAGEVRVTGETRSYTVTGDSTLPSTRHFCAVCFSQIFGSGDATPGILTLYAGNLDDMAVFEPQMVIYARSRPAWDRVIDDLPEFETTPS